MIRELIIAGTPAHEVEQKVMEKYHLDDVIDAREIIAIELGDPDAGDDMTGRDS